jgi:leukocyte elastase inhibitor
MQEKEYTVLARCSAALAVDLCQKLWNRENNLVISPYSIATIAALMYAGSRKTTRQQIGSVMHLEFDEEELHGAFGVLNLFVNKPWAPQSYLRAANAIWICSGHVLSEQFRSLITKRYATHVVEEKVGQPFDTTLREINDWIADKTNGMIPNLLDNLDPQSVLVLVSAVCFRDDWQSPFDKAETRSELFHIGTRLKARVRMMKQTGGFCYAASRDLKVLRLPYSSGDTSMLIFLPRARDGIRRLVASIDAQSIAQWQEKLESRQVTVSIPQLRMETSVELVPALASLGIVDAFDPSKADFSAMSDQPVGMYIGRIIHKALIEVDEAGTKAAAAIASVFLTDSGSIRRRKLPPVEFRADRPFVFAIVHSVTGSLLFLGIVNNPLLGAQQDEKAG